MPTEELFSRYRTPNLSPGATAIPQSTARVDSNQQTQPDGYDWEAFDYIKDIDFDTYKECMTNLEGFQALFADVSTLPASQRNQVLGVVAQMAMESITQGEYVGRLGQIAEIVGNENMIRCVDAVKSYEYDLANKAASDGAAANGNGTTNENGANGNGNGGENGQLSLVDKAKGFVGKHWLKATLATLVAGLSYYGYKKYSSMAEDKQEEDEDDIELLEGEVFVPKDFGKRKKARAPILEVDDSDGIDLLEGESWVPRNFGKQRNLRNPKKKKRKIKLNPKKKRK
jgi:hypothetical protein